MLKLGEFFLSILIIYIIWFKEAIGNSQIILYGLFLLSIACVLLDAINRKRLPIKGIVATYLLYGIYSLVTGVFVSTSSDCFASMIITYFAFAISCYCIYYVSINTNSIEWILRVMLFSSILCAVYTIVAGVDYKTEVIVKTMSLNNNPHTLGITMLLGIFSITAHEKKSKKTVAITIALIGLFSYVILISGSRKCLIAAVLLLVIWAINMIITENRFTKKKLIIICCICMLLVIGIYYVINTYMNSAMFERLLMLVNSSGAADSRWRLYTDAFAFWKTHPFVGIGFGQYQVLSPFKLYSHSSYAEILSCGGIFGMIIFFGPLIKMYVGMLKEVKVTKKTHRYDILMCAVMMTVELFLGIGQIYIYSLQHMIIILYLYMNYEHIKRKNVEV